MSKEYIGEYNPNYAVPPGWLLEERLEIREWSQAEFARRCGRSAKLISDIVAGKAPIEPDTALQFEKVLDLEASVWLNLEASFQLYLAREREKEVFKGAVEWFERFPIKEMVKGGMLERPQTPLRGIKDLLTFFGVGNPTAWENKIGANVALARHTPKFQSSSEAVSVWLRLGELDALKQECAPYDVTKFREALTEIRLLSRSEPAEFYPRMLKRCNDAGVALVLIPPFKGNKLSGAAWWLQRKTPVIQLTLRGKWSDVFWFTFFHEAAHILLHSRKDTFVDEDTRDGTKCEDEANDWARDILIPAKDWEDFTFKGVFSGAAIHEFALEQGISPAIILGRLQFEDMVKWQSPLTKILKERYEIV